MRVLEELLGDADEEPGDKSSTGFAAFFEGESFTLNDWHVPEDSGVPECRVDPEYVWEVWSERHDVSRFCAWLSGEIRQRVSPAVAERYAWPLPGDPAPTPPPPPKPAPAAVKPVVRARLERPAEAPLGAHRRRVLALQQALDVSDSMGLAELESDLSRLGPDAQALARLLGRYPELPESEARERVGRGYDGACAELDAFLRGMR